MEGNELVEPEKHFAGWSIHQLRLVCPRHLVLRGCRLWQRLHVERNKLVGPAEHRFVGWRDICQFYLVWFRVVLRSLRYLCQRHDGGRGELVEPAALRSLCCIHHHFLLWLCLGLRGRRRPWQHLHVERNELVEP